MILSSSGKKALLAFLTISISFSAIGQNEPVSQTANSMVDLLTGDFNYSLPVMTVPGPNGENVPITFSYRGGIRMDEEASWIGLGWNYNPGEITRSVKGVPDDWNGKGVTVKKGLSESETTETTNFYGPLYFSNCPAGNNTKMDIATSSYRLLSSQAFSFPDYDQFNVSGPGVSGPMSARIFSWGGFFTGNISPYAHAAAPAFPSMQRVHFYFDNDISHHRMSQEGGVYSGSNVEYSSSSNRVHDGNCIEYYTNAYINQNFNTARSNGFLDYRIISGTKRPTAEFDPDGIGAFQITTPSGMVYHYSLPVYTLDGEKNTCFNLNLSDENPTSGYEMVTKVNRYAISWKLTAVTGPDYNDANDNGVADFGDSGYWIRYNYGKWVDNFNWRYPYFNYIQNVYDKRASSNFSLGQFMYQTVKSVGMTSSGFTQRYYLNSIQTATHTACFIKEARLDNHAVKETDGGVVPSLRLSKIVLLRNADFSQLNMSSAFTCDSRFSLANTNCLINNIHPHINDYVLPANKDIFGIRSLATVELSFNYNLCKMVYNNIYNTFDTYSIVNYPLNTHIYQRFQHGSSSSGSAETTNSGKLTLTSVKLFSIGYSALEPNYIFDYDQGSTLKNPDYNTFKSDYWGYYKSDYNQSIRGKYTSPGTNGSFQHTDAWSLKKITTPLGGNILINYESDKYEQANYGGTTASYQSPKLIFPIHNFSLASQSTVTIEKIGVSKEINSFMSFPDITRRRVFIPFTINVTNAPICTTSVLFSNYLRDSCSTCNPFPALSTTTGSTDQTQQFNFSFTYPGSGCDGAWSVGKTISYQPLLQVGNVHQGWGYVRLTMPYMYGGGLRVKQITFQEPDSEQSYVNEYSYEKGVAGSEPVHIFDYGAAIGANRNAGDPAAPPSVVNYGKVTVRSKGMDQRYNGKTEYEFDNMLEPYDIRVGSKITVPPVGHPGYSTVMTYYFAKEIVGASGRLTSVKDYDNNNNIVRSEVYTYHWDIYFEPSITESFTHKIVDDANQMYFTTEYVKTKVKARVNYVTTYKDGIVTREEFLEFDPYTGQSTVVRTMDPSNGIRETRIQLAYKDYPGMGPKLKSPGNHHLLTAVSKQTVYADRLMRDIYNNLVGTGKPELISGSKTTWRQIIPIRKFDGTAYVSQTQSVNTWLPNKTYRFNGDLNDANWREESEITLFDSRLHSIETKSGVGNRYTSTKLGYGKQFELCSASDCKYVDISFSGFEEVDTIESGLFHFGGELTKGQLRDNSVTAHTGKYIAKVLALSTGPEYITKDVTKGRSYRAAVWVRSQSPAETKLVVKLNGTVNGAPIPEKSVSKSTSVAPENWILLTLTFEVPENYVSASGTNDLVISLKNDGNNPAYFDDFMFRPVDAVLSGNVIDETTGRTLATLNSENLATFYTYGKGSRLIRTQVEVPQSFRITRNEYQYNFKRNY